MPFKHVLAALGAVALSGCAEVASNTVAGCGGTAAQSNLQEVMEKNIAKIVPQIFERDEFLGTVTTVEIKRAARTLSLALDDARTADDRPNSTARLCRATAKLKLPGSMVESVEGLLRAKGEGDLDKLAAGFDGEKRGGSVDFDIEYEVQPTDDAAKVITEATTDQGLFKFAAAFVALQLRSPEASAQIAAAQREAAEEQATAVRSEQEIAEATQQSEVAAMEEARTESRLARQTINAVWTNLEPDQRQSMLELQRAWLKRKQADCNLESASSSTDPEQKAIAFLKCDTRVTQERIQWLRNNSPASNTRTVSEDGPWYNNATDNK